ncbi:unnamed protein product [Tilletia caries]|nr:unnamed protein product [Tilletia caries]
MDTPRAYVADESQEQSRMLPDIAGAGEHSPAQPSDDPNDQRLQHIEALEAEDLAAAEDLQRREVALQAARRAHEEQRRARRRTINQLRTDEEGPLDSDSQVGSTTNGVLNQIQSQLGTLTELISANRREMLERFRGLENAGDASLAQLRPTMAGANPAPQVQFAPQPPPAQFPQFQPPATGPAPFLLGSAGPRLNDPHQRVPRPSAITPFTFDGGFAAGQVANPQPGRNWPPFPPQYGQARQSAAGAANAAASSDMAQSFRRNDYPRSKDIGHFDPDDEKTKAYLWWQKLEHFTVVSRYGKAETLPVLMSCMQGRAETWISSIQPIPTTCAQWRKAFLQEFIPSATKAHMDLDVRKFEPDKETMSAYLHEKYSLVGQWQVANALERGLLDEDRDAIRDIVGRISIMDLIFYVHQGLPAEWKLETDNVKASAQSWSDYRSAMVEKEDTVRNAHAERQALMRSSISRQTPRADATSKFTTRAVPTVARPQPDNEKKKARAEDRALGRCYLCQTVGHFARDCPSNPDSARGVRRDERLAARRAMAGEAIPHSSGEEDSGESDEEDRVGTVAIARRIGSLVEEVGLSALPDDDQAFVRGLKSDLPGSRFRITQAGTLAVWVDGSPRRYDICPDSGADLSTISSSTLAAVSPGAKILAPAKVEIQGYAGGMAQKPTGVVRLPLHFQAVNGKRVSREAEFHVVSECADGWLLGADNLAHFGFVVNLRDRVVTLADDNTIKIPLRNGKGVDPAARLLVVSRSITIPAHASALVPVRPPRQEATLQPYLFQNDDLSDQWISAGKGLVGPQTLGVLFLNASDRTLARSRGRPSTRP